MSSSEVKQTQPTHDPNTKTTGLQENSAINPHPITGSENFVASGGSGGVPLIHGQGFENLAEHP